MHQRTGAGKEQMKSDPSACYIEQHPSLVKEMCQMLDWAGRRQQEQEVVVVYSCEVPIAERAD